VAASDTLNIVGATSGVLELSFQMHYSGDLLTVLDARAFSALGFGLNLDTTNEYAAVVFNSLYSMEGLTRTSNLIFFEDGVSIFTPAQVDDWRNSPSNIVVRAAFPFTTPEILLRYNIGYNLECRTGLFSTCTTGVDASRTAALWGARIFDVDYEEEIPGATLVAQSGFDYTATPVPEPSLFVVFCFAVGTGLLRRLTLK
jgi:hypothetical protein